MNELDGLGTSERECTLRYLSTLKARLGSELQQVWLFGSAARGEMSSEQSTMRSDIDLLVLTRYQVPGELKDELVDATYPLFLEFGRQIAPQFRSLEEFYAPIEPERVAFSEQVRQHGRVLYANR